MHPNKDLKCSQCHQAPATIMSLCSGCFDTVFPPLQTVSTSSVAPPDFYNEVVKFAVSQGMPWAKKEKETMDDKKTSYTMLEQLKQKYEEHQQNKKMTPAFTGDDDIDGMLFECIKTLEVKGNDYTQGAGNSDRLKNFNDGANQFGLQPRQVLGVYLWKHLCAVLRYIKEGQVESEPIQSRIMDCINYFLLLHKMNEEERRLKAILDE